MFLSLHSNCPGLITALTHKRVENKKKTEEEEERLFFSAMDVDFIIMCNPLVICFAIQLNLRHIPWHEIPSDLRKWENFFFFTLFCCFVRVSVFPYGNWTLFTSNAARRSIESACAASDTGPLSVNREHRSGTPTHSADSVMQLTQAASAVLDTLWCFTPERSPQRCNIWKHNLFLRHSRRSHIHRVSGVFPVLTSAPAAFPESTKVEGKHPRRV